MKSTFNEFKEFLIRGDNADNGDEHYHVPEKHIATFRLNEKHIIFNHVMVRPIENIGAMVRLYNIVDIDVYPIFDISVVGYWTLAKIIVGGPYHE